MPFSFHSHSAQFCKHARGGSLEDVVQAAVKAGMSHLGMSEHVPRYAPSELYPEEAEAHMSPDDLVVQFDSFVAEARRLQVAYARKIHLLVGAETEYMSEDSPRLMKELRERHRLDYIVASVHHVDGMPIDFDEAMFQQAVAKQQGLEPLLHKYLDHQLCLIEGLKPEVVGHFDVVRKYCPNAAFTGHLETKMRRNLEACARYGCLLEINSSGVGKRIARPFPGEDVLRLAQDAGVRFTISDDAHSPDDIALYYGQLRQYVRDCGVADEIYCLERDADAAQVEQRHVANFLHHPFWDSSPVYELSVT